MCGRFALTVDPAAVQQAFSLSGMPEQMTPRYNIAPTQPVAVITNDDASALTFHRWGLVPSWAKDISMGSKLINARGETVHEKPSFRSAFRRRRCLIVTDGYFEWQTTDGSKQPYFIFLKGKPVFALAGIWEIWHSPEGDELRTCSIITTEANEFMTPLHDRMPVILDPKDYDQWLQKGEVKAESLLPLIRGFDSDAMEAYAVSKAVNKPVNDSPEIIVPLAS